MSVPLFNNSLLSTAFSIIQQQFCVEELVKDHVLFSAQNITQLFTSRKMRKLGNKPLAFKRCQYYYKLIVIYYSVLSCTCSSGNYRKNLHYSETVTILLRLRTPTGHKPDNSVFTRRVGYYCRTRLEALVVISDRPAYITPIKIILLQVISDLSG